MQLHSDVQKEIVKKLTSNQIFILYILSGMGFIAVVWLLCMLYPEALGDFFEIF